MLVQSIVSEVGATLFNLSPRNTAGQFVGKTNVSKMIHMVFKVGRAKSPAIIFIDGVEMIFAKKVPKDDTSDPKRIRKDLVKSIKLIKSHAEKVVLIATSSKPWDGDVKALLGLFDKALYCPPPDYSTRYHLWETFCRQHTDVPLNISLLAYLSEGLTAGAIEMICSRILTARRIKNFRVKPLKCHEFISLIYELKPTVNEEAKLFKVKYVNKGLL
jgi:SpoVK/Ycf46/Vps4 family AAA+-type ATPase